MLIQLISFVITVLLVITALIFKPACEFIGGGTPLTQTQKEVSRLYRDMKLPTHKIPFDEFCRPKNFRLQPPQKFIAEYMAPETPHMNLLGFHRIGAGKSCSIIQACERWIGRGKPLVVMPASLVGNFLNELRGPCAGGKYISEACADELRTLTPRSPRYKEIIKKSNDAIFAKYDIMSYNKFADSYARLNPPIMAIDEVHNVNNPTGTYYAAVNKFVSARPTMKLIAFSATPVFDHPSEIISLLKLMRQDVSMEMLDDLDALAEHADGLISYYEGAPAYTFPKATLHYEICTMSPFQSKWYRAEVEGELKRTGDIRLNEISNSFYSKSRARSNIVFPKGLAGTYGLPELTKSKILDSLGTYSCKLTKLMRKLRKNQLSFVYTNYTSFGGIRAIYKCLTAHGFKSYNKHGPGPRRFALWTGDTTSRERDAIRSVFNSPANDDASQIQIIVGSPSIREGVSLQRVRQIHVLEPYWNHSRLEQIYGRGIRFCSHKSLPSRERTVDIYLYIAVTHDSGITKRNFAARGDINPTLSIDGHILRIADRKRDINGKIIQVLVASAVDRGLNNRKSIK